MKAKSPSGRKGSDTTSEEATEGVAYSHKAIDEKRMQQTTVSSATSWELDSGTRMDKKCIRDQGATKERHFHGWVGVVNRQVQVQVQGRGSSWQHINLADSLRFDHSS